MKNICYFQHDPEELLIMEALLEDILRSELGNAFHIERMSPVTGGDSNRAVRVDGTDRSLFVKIRPGRDRTMFETEAEGLQTLAACSLFRIPAVIAQTTIGDTTFLALEWLDLNPLGRTEHAARAGEALAALHRMPHPRYGWHRDNFIGLGAQPNGWSDDWVDFFVSYRLKPQLARASDPVLKRSGEKICADAARLFNGYVPEASLLHGDLWGGNTGVTAAGEIALFDPACYFGDREADLAMTELFGGFPSAFYDAYDNAWPTDAGADSRRDFYNLYHIINHYNLFGGGYLTQARRMAERVAALVGA